jgi:thermostable 8-oxoguanine DNA glycosylase
MEQYTPMHVVNWYRNNFDHYKTVRAKLSAMRQKFDNASLSEKVIMLQKSHAFAVISIQAKVEEHEKAFQKLFKNGLPITETEIRNSINNVIYWKNKSEYIYESLTNGREWEKIARMLENSQVDKAHKYMIDNIKGVSTAKVPFVLAMLGFTEKMCIDSNICDLMNIEKPTTVVVERYEKMTDKIKQKFKTLAKETYDSFMFQWVLFDYARDTLATHNTFYKELGVM